MILPTACQHCDESLRRKAAKCEACGASYVVRDTAVGSMYLMVGLMGFGVLTLGNAYYQTWKMGDLDTVMSIVFPSVLLLLVMIGRWFWTQARKPQKWVEWTEGVAEFADMKILEAGGTLPDLGGSGLSGLGGDKK